MSYTYDANGNITSRTDENGDTSYYTYNTFDLPLTETDPLGNVTTYTYDESANRTSITDASGATTSFGYNTLVTDFRAIPELKSNGVPVVFDATHSVQQPGGKGAASGGQREFAPVLARAAVAVGVGGVFMEVHQDPDHAPSDGPNMIRLDELEGILATLKAYDELTKSLKLPL